MTKEMGLLAYALLTGFLVMVATFFVQAGPFEDGKTAYDRGDYVVALHLWRQAAEQGNTEAQFKLGALYEQGCGVPQDDAMAAQWYRKAAQQGDARAQFRLGVLYEQGRGVPQDYAVAAQWYYQAAQQGDADAPLSLGVLYEKGCGVPQDYSVAAQWYRKAARMMPAQLEEAQRQGRE